MTQYSALLSIVFMICFVGVFDIRHRRLRFSRLLSSITLMTADELDQIRRIQDACLES